MHWRRDRALRKWATSSTLLDVFFNALQQGRSGNHGIFGSQLLHWNHENDLSRATDFLFRKQLDCQKLLCL